MIVSAESDGRKIETFDWTTMAYQIQPARFQKNRALCSCGLLKNKNGYRMVVVGGERQIILNTLFS